MTNYEPGPALDSKVAELMGMSGTKDVYVMKANGVTVCRKDFNPSTDIRDAMVVVEWVERDGFEWSISGGHKKLKTVNFDNGYGLEGDVMDESVPFAICLAFVEACDG